MAESVVLHGVSDDLLRVAIAAHLARYKGLSRAHTSSDLQVFLRWCANHQFEPLTVRQVEGRTFPSGKVSTAVSKPIVDAPIDRISMKQPQPMWI
jgi:hypothetical protein